MTKEAWTQAPKWSREGSEPFVKDAWGFAEEERLGRPAVVGLIRVPVAKVSSRARSTAWVQVSPSKGSSHATSRLTTSSRFAGSTKTPLVPELVSASSKPKYGIFLGKRQVGMRHQAGSMARASRIRYFALKSTPANWSDDLVRDLVEEQTSLKQVHGQGQCHLVLQSQGGGGRGLLHAEGRGWDRHRHVVGHPGAG